MAGAARDWGGSPDVYVNDLPQLRKGDNYKDEGEILGGSSDVYVNDQPAARGGDSTEEDHIGESSGDTEKGI